MQTRTDVEKKLKNSRGNLLAVVLFSAVNAVSALSGSGIGFFFAAVIPTILVEVGQMVPAYSAICTVAALTIIAFYFVCYLLSKKNRAFLIVALILFSIDTLLLLLTLFLGIDFMTIVNLGFHAWVLSYLMAGVKAWTDLQKKRYEEEPVPALESKEPSTKKCAFCGEEIPSDAMFCQFCGGNIGEKEEADQRQKQQEEEAYKRRKRQEFEEKGLNILFDDAKVMEEANMYRRFYSKKACVSYLKSKAKEFGLGDIELTEEDVE